MRDIIVIPHFEWAAPENDNVFKVVESTGVAVVQ
jgi:hypothetical protein